MYDLAVIGSGWAGLNASLRAKQLGLKVTLIDKDEVGGTCLNLGCIPTKALNQSLKVFNLIKKSSTFGINSSVPSVDFIRVQERKVQLIATLRANLQAMLEGIDFLSGVAQVISPQEIKLLDKTIQAKAILIASGSEPYALDAFKFDARKIISSNEMLSLKEIPGTLLIIGGGVIGCEFASLFAGFGSRVSIVEKMPQLIPGVDKEIAKKIEGVFKKKGIKVNTHADAAAFNPLDFDLVLVCVGRSPCIRGLGLEKLGLSLEQGRIVVDEYLRTNIPHIYAAGDCASKIMLAHFAAYQGNLAAGNIARPRSPQALNSSYVPSCIFTDPQIAYVGLSEDAALALGLDIAVRKFDFLASGMARILDETEGFIKVILDNKTSLVLGASIIGPNATELIATLSVAISCRINIQDLRRVIFSHPTLSESIAEVFK